jgi:hypothetical protein
MQSRFARARFQTISRQKASTYNQLHVTLYKTVKFLQLIFNLNYFFIKYTFDWEYAMPRRVALAHPSVLSTAVDAGAAHATQSMNKLIQLFIMHIPLINHRGVM